jgi:hypothetical protein
MIDAGFQAIAQSVKAKMPFQNFPQQLHFSPIFPIKKPSLRQAERGLLMKLVLFGVGVLFPLHQSVVFASISYLNRKEINAIRQARSVHGDLVVARRQGFCRLHNLDKFAQHIVEFDFH